MNALVLIDSMVQQVTVLERFAHDDEPSVRAVLRDLALSGLELQQALDEVLDAIAD